MKSRIWSLACVLALALPCFAADEKPVPTIAEPYHRTVLQNDYVRMIDVRMAQGVRNQFHIHTLPTVIIYLTQVTNQSEIWGTPGTSPRHTVPGDSRYANYDEKSLAHRVTNEGPGEFRVWDIELLRPAPSGPFPPAGAAALKPKWEEKRVRSSNVLLDPAAAVTIAPGPCAHLVVPIASGLATQTHGREKSDRTLAAGEFLFVAPQTGLELRNPGKDKVDVVVLELR